MSERVRLFATNLRALCFVSYIDTDGPIRHTKLTNLFEEKNKIEKIITSADLKSIYLRLLNQATLMSIFYSRYNLIQITSIMLNAQYIYM